MKSEEFDRAFDDGEDVTAQLDMSAARRPGLEQRRVNVDFPEWMIESLDREARRLGVNRQSIIKVWIAEAATPQDLHAYLDEKVLRRLWALLWLPVQLRRAWEQRFPVLAEISRVT